MVWHFIPAVRTERLVFVASTDPRPEKSQAGVSDGLGRERRLDTRPRRLVGAHEHVPGIRGIHLPGSGPYRPRRAVTHLDHSGHAQSSRRLGHHAADRAHVRPRRSHAGREQVVLVSHNFWQRQLSSRADAIGKTLSIDGRPHTIVGVLPQRAGAGIFRTVDAVTPIVLDRERNKRDDRRLYVTAC